MTTYLDENTVLEVFRAMNLPVEGGDTEEVLRDRMREHARPLDFGQIAPQPPLYLSNKVADFLPRNRNAQLERRR